MRSLVAWTVLVSTSFGTSLPAFAQGANAVALVKAGEAAAGQRDWQTAKARFIEATVADDKCALAYYDLGVAQAHLNDMRGAVESERKALAIDSKFVGAYVELGWLQCQLKEFEAATDSLNKALALDPNNKAAQHNLDGVYNAKASFIKRMPAPVSVVAPRQAVLPVTPQVVASAPTGSAPIMFAPTSESNLPAATPDVSTTTVTSTATSVATSNVTSVEHSTAAPSALVELKSPIATSNVPATAPVAVLEKTAPETNVPATIVELKSPIATNGSAPVSVAESTTVTTTAQTTESNPVSTISTPIATFAAESTSTPVAVAVASNTPAASTAAASISTTMSVAELIAAGSGAFKKGQLEDAKSFFQKAVLSDSNNALAHADLGVVLGTLGSFEQQMIEEKRAVELDPKNARAWANLGWAQSKLLSWTDALGSYQKALQLNDKLFEAQCGQAIALFHGGKEEAGLAAIKLAIKASPHSPNAKIVLANMLQAQMKYPEAETQLREALKLSPNNGEARQTLAAIQKQTAK